MSNKDLKNFEKNIGYSFKDIEHLKIALTHKSFIDEEPTSPTNCLLYTSPSPRDRG